MSKSFFSSQIIDKEKGCVLWNELRKIRNKDLNDSKLDHMFGPPFKLYPSQMAFDMCWYQFFKDIDNPPRFTLNSMYRMRRGSSIHREIQDDFLKSGLCYEVPTDKLTKEQISKLKYHAPELPFTDLDTLVSGRADLLLNIKKKPVLVEIKTTYLEETAWIKDKPIEKKVDQYNKHLCQAAVCTYVINKMRFLDQKIDQFVLMYLDPRFEPERPGQ